MVGSKKCVAMATKQKFAPRCCYPVDMNDGEETLSTTEPNRTSIGARAVPSRADARERAMMVVGWLVG